MSRLPGPTATTASSSPNSICRVNGVSHLRVASSFRYATRRWRRGSASTAARTANTSTSTADSCAFATTSTNADGLRSATRNASPRGNGPRFEICCQISVHERLPDPKTREFSEKKVDLAIVDLEATERVGQAVLRDPCDERRSLEERVGVCRPARGRGRGNRCPFDVLPARHRGPVNQSYAAGAGSTDGGVARGGPSR